MKIGSLFAGIGGFDLAAESLGWSTAWVSEIDPFACAVLAKHFPRSPNLGDITRIDWSTVERPDILCAGFPCQPHSLAGKRAGSDDDRDLWGECVRSICCLRPDYFVFENVTGLVSSEYGGFFNRVLSDLAELGYDAEWSVLSACAVGAPHTRERVFGLAYPSRIERTGGVQYEDSGTQGSRAEPSQRCEDRVGLEVAPANHPIYAKWGSAPDPALLADGLREELVAATKGFGNAIVPLCAVAGPFRRIIEIEAAI